MRQVCAWRSVGNPATTTSYISPATGGTWTTTIANGTHPWAVTGTFNNLSITLASAPASGKSIAFTLLVNGVASALTCTVSNTATAAQDSTHSVSITDGDTVSLRAVGSGTPTVSAVMCALEFVSTTTGESGYGGAATANVGGTGARNNGLLWPVDIINWGGTASLAAVAGTVTAYRVALTGAPGGVATQNFTVFKNLVAQDGTGGTPDTRLTITGAATTGVATFSMTVAPGDQLLLQRSSGGGSPAATAITFGVRFVATTDGEAMIGCSGGGIASLTLTQYMSLSGGANIAWDTTESNRYLTSGVTQWYASKLYVLPSNAQNGTGSAQYVRVNGVTGSLGVTTIVAGVASNLVSSATVPAGATVSMEYVPNVPTTARAFTWCMRQTMTNPLASERAWTFLGMASGSTFIG
jgi:hypothetical protein